MRILIVEDDVLLADLLAEALTKSQYVVDVALEGETACQWLETLHYDLVLLDLTLPKTDGIRFCQQLRERNTEIAILILSARNSISDKIAALDAGADTYLTKPFDFGELLAQIRALLRRSGTKSHPKLHWDNLCLDSTACEVTYCEQVLNLTRKEYALLELLLTNGRKVLSKPNIIDRLWSLDNSPTEEAVKTHIRTLRQKLRNVGAPVDLIETVHGLGYRMKQVKK